MRGRRRHCAGLVCAVHGARRACHSLMRNKLSGAQVTGALTLSFSSVQPVLCISDLLFQILSFTKFRLEIIYFAGRL